jgi:hypothetical protein
MTPAQSGFSVLMPRKKPVTLTAAVEAFLDGLVLTDAERVLAALAVELARSFEDTPPYARAKIAAELRVCLAELREQAEEQRPRLARAL